MNDFDMEYPENPQLSLAAALHLLSSASLEGTSVARCRALLTHLDRLSMDREIAAPLRNTCACLYYTWVGIMQSMEGKSKRDSLATSMPFTREMRLH